MSGNVYINLATAVGDYLMSGSSGCQVDETNNESYTFDIDVDGDYNDLPQEESDDAHACQVSLRVWNEYDSGSHSIKFTPEYTFRYPTMPYDCTCGGYYWYTKTTVPGLLGFATYDVV